MNRREALFEMLKGNKVRRIPWVKECYAFIGEDGIISFWSDAVKKKTLLDLNSEPYGEWEFAYPEKKATYKEAIKAFHEGKAIKDPDGKVHQIDAYAKENEGECYTIIDEVEINPPKRRYYEIIRRNYN